MHLFWREMKAHRKPLIIWCISVLFLIASGMSKYSAAASVSGQSLNDLMSKMPTSLQLIMGTGSFDLSKASGYFGVLFIYIAFMATIHSSMLGSNIISKEERDKTIEFLMVKPITRSFIITSKLLAAFANVVIFNTVTLVSSIGIVRYYSKGEDPTSDIVKVMVGLFLLQLIFLVIGTGIAAISKKPKLSGAVSATLLFATYILSIVIDLNSKLENLKYLTPFKYYEAKKLMAGGSFDPIFVIMSIAIIAALIAITYKFYKKRDLNV